MSARTTHDCVKARCDTDTRTASEVEFEGYAAGKAGASYEECPYGHTHPDVRFNPWQRGRSMALGEWCYAHRQTASWCEGNDDPVIGWPAEETPCRTEAPS